MGDAMSSPSLLDLDNLTPELLTTVLSYLPASYLIKTCRRVCKQWRDIVDTNTIWRIKCLREQFYVPHLMGPPPADFKEYYFKNPYNRNLVKNPSGKDGTECWEVEEDGGDQFLVETTSPQAPGVFPSDDVKNEGFETCWATSYGWCVKHQLIDLLEEGCSALVLDQVRPSICISEWTAARRDCASTYKLHIQLRGEDREKVIDEFSKQRQVEQWQGGNWEKIEHKFTKYPPGVRYIWYQHSGKDLQFWAGHYGSKFGASTVRFQFGEQTSHK